MKKEKCVALLLACQRGERLYALTSDKNKAAVSFGGKYRIIDFALSNCINSGITTVGVVTDCADLCDYIGRGESWDLDRATGGVVLLTNGNANSVRNNLRFLDKHDCENIIILRGDFIYKMDYSELLGEHIRRKADCTVGFVDVDSADKYGIIDIDEGVVASFEHKPTFPKSNHACMGVYIFRKDVLIDVINGFEGDDWDEFEKNVLPVMIQKEYRVCAHKFNGYWSDVDTVTSLFEANMDLLSGKFDLSDRALKIHSHNEPLAPCFVGGGEVVNSLVSAGCEIYGTVINSVLSGNVTIAKGGVVENSIVMSGTIIGENASLNYAILGEDVTVGDGAEIGDEQSNENRIALIGNGAEIESGMAIASNRIVKREVSNE